MNQEKRIEILKERDRLLRMVREFFHRLDFIEVQTPVLSADTMVDMAIDPIKVSVSGRKKSFYLQTSPEFAMKRLLLEGMERIFEITPAFRNAEAGSRHNPEFTMLEWYRVGDTYEQGIKLLADLARYVLPDRQIETLSYAEVFQKRLGIDPHKADLGQLQTCIGENRLEVPDGQVDRDSLLQILMSDLIEPGLGQMSISIVKDWPASQSALARIRATDKGYSVAERFELYVDGVEIANGYHELTDPAEQLLRLEQNNRTRRTVGLPELPPRSKLLESMFEKRLPDCCGVAIGFDRLLMVKLGLKQLSEVLVFDIQRA